MRVRGFVRYMDDSVWWTDDRASARSALDAAEVFLDERLGLTVKQPVRVGRSGDGLMFCGFRILPGRLLLSRRRKRRYAALRAAAETDFLAGDRTMAGLQSAYAGALALTVHADAAAWRREQMRRRPVAAALAAL
jgi:hypothetical protein